MTNGKTKGQPLLAKIEVDEGQREDPSLGVETDAMGTEACLLQTQLFVLEFRPHYLLPEPGAT